METNTDMSNQRSIFPILLIIVGGLFLVGAIIIVLNSGPSVQPVPILSATPTEVAITDIQRVSLVDAKAAFDQKTAVFVDVRDAQTYANRHIPNALSIPLADILTNLSELKKSDWIITVCT
jgi:3-mercaptopyruvate sulfurtransferase SseA